MEIEVRYWTKDNEKLELTIQTNFAAHSLFSDYPEIVDSIKSCIRTTIYEHFKLQETINSIGKERQ